jgi:hypothetical protein
MRINKEDYDKYITALILVIHARKNDCWDWKTYWQYLTKQISVCSKRSKTLSRFFTDLSNQMKCNDEKIQPEHKTYIIEMLNTYNEDIDFIRYIRNENVSIITKVRLFLEDRIEKSKANREIKNIEKEKKRDLILQEKEKNPTPIELWDM